MNQENEPVREGKDLIERWRACQDQERMLKSELISAQCQTSNAESALAKWLTPSDGKPGEKIAVWFGDSLVQVEIGGVVSGESEGQRHITESRVTVRSIGKYGLKRF